MAPIPEWRAALLVRPDLSPIEPPLIHEACQAELDALLKEKTAQIIFKAQTSKRLKLFYDHPKDFFCFGEFFERIGKVSDGKTEFLYYSLRYNRLKKLGNLRILFVVFKGKPFMIHAFLEQQGSSYNKAKEVLRTRLKEGRPE